MVFYFWLPREDHAVRIEVGYGLEGVVTDLQAAKIIRDILIPAFKSDDLMGGLTLASENIGALLLNGELPEDRGIITVSIPYSIIACCNYIAGGTFIFYCFYRSVEFTTGSLSLAPFTGWYSSMLPSEDHGPI